MSTTASLISAIKAELKSAGITYAELGRRLGMAESSMKRIFASGEMPLSRVDDICRELNLDFTDLARLVAARQSLPRQLTTAQERAVVTTPKLLLAAISCLSQWTLEQIVATYRISEVECIKLFLTLDRLGIIELRPMNRYRVKIASTFRWLPNGPVIEYFRKNVVGEYFEGAFDGDGELLRVVFGSLNPRMAALLNERLLRVAEDFARQHLDPPRVPDDVRQPYTLILSMRSWWFSAFDELKR